MERYTVNAERKRLLLPKKFDLGALDTGQEGFFSNGIDEIQIKNDPVGLRLISKGPYPIRVESDEIVIFGNPVLPSETLTLKPTEPGIIVNGFRVHVYPSAESGKTQRLVITLQTS